MGESSSSRATSAHSTKVSTTSFVARPSSRDSQYNTLRCARNRPRTSRAHTATAASKSRRTARSTAAARSGCSPLKTPSAFRFGADSISFSADEDSSATTLRGFVSDAAVSPSAFSAASANAARFAMELAGVTRPGFVRRIPSVGATS